MKDIIFVVLSVGNLQIPSATDHFKNKNKSYFGIF